MNHLGLSERMTTCEHVNTMDSIKDGRCHQYLVLWEPKVDKVDWTVIIWSGSCVHKLHRYGTQAQKSAAVCQLINETLEFHSLKLDYSLFGWSVPHSEL